jgi:hypothetical protein
MIILIAGVLAFIPVTIAKNKGRSFGGWYVHGFMLFVVALIHAPGHEAGEGELLRGQRVLNPASSHPFAVSGP